MTFEEILDQALAMLQRRGRVTYQTLRLQFQLDEEHLEALKEAILFAYPQVVDAAGRGLVWSGDAGAIPPPTSVSPQSGAPRVTLAPRVGTTAVSPPEPQPPEAERRQLTVLFCDLVDSTVLASQLDPEEWREVVRAYQDTCAKVIARFEGHIAQYLGDGLLVYFGYPLAHEDDAPRAVRAGLGMIEALGQLNTRLEQERGVHLAVRLGIHTVWSSWGRWGAGRGRNSWPSARPPTWPPACKALAAPNTLVISATTFQLLGGFFACQPLGTPPLKGHAQPLAVYRVLYESTARSRLEAAGSTGPGPRWWAGSRRSGCCGSAGRRSKRARAGGAAEWRGGHWQIAPGAGADGTGGGRTPGVATPCQCSPYHQNTALYPMIELLERVALRFEREESPEQKCSKLEGVRGAVWPAAGRSRTALCLAPLPAVGRRLCPPDRIA